MNRTGRIETPAPHPRFGCASQEVHTPQPPGGVLPLALVANSPQLSRGRLGSRLPCSVTPRGCCCSARIGCGCSNGCGRAVPKALPRQGRTQVLPRRRRARPGGPRRGHGGRRAARQALFVLSGDYHDQRQVHMHQEGRRRHKDRNRSRGRPRCPESRSGPPTARSSRPSTSRPTPAGAP